MSELPTVRPSPDARRWAEESGGRRVFRWAVNLCWLYQPTAILALGLWIFADGRFGSVVGDLSQQLTQGEFRSLRAAFPGRVLILQTTLAGGALGFVGILLGLFIGDQRHRRVRSWLFLTAIAAAWLTLLNTWPHLAWEGRQWRLARQLAEFEKVAAGLRTSWPVSDGETAALGTFMAYPRGRPAMLLVISPPDGEAKLSVSAVERSADGSLRFELAGSESGAWLEWRPHGAMPRSFRGGLDTEYSLVRCAPLKDGWFVVDYHP